MRPTFLPSARFLVASAVTAALLLPTAVQAETGESGSPINDFRIGIDALLQPTVKERITTDSTSTYTGQAGEYDWSRGSVLDQPGLRIEGAYFQGMSRRERATSGFIWAVGLNYAWWDMNPSNFGTAPTLAVGNGRQTQSVTYQQIGAMVGAGYATQPRYTSSGDLHFEFMPTLRGGWATAQTVTPGDSPTVEEGGAPWWEIGGKAALVLMDERWVLDLHLGYAYGECHPSINLPNINDGGNARSGTDKMDLITNSPYLGLMIGWRF